MRVTNGMIRNTTLNGLYNNMSALNKTYAQMATGKKIQTVSDDPIIAGRALKLRTTVLEVGQYQKNVKEAMSWMEITEAALDNITEILKEIRNKCIQATNGTLEKEDKDAIKTDIAQLWEQLQDEANVTYGGRYVFTGYKTDQPLFLSQQLEIKDNATELKGALSIGGNSNIAIGSILKEGTTLGKGSILGGGITLNSGTILGPGTTLNEADAQAAIGGGFTLVDGEYTYDADYELEADKTMSKEAMEALKPIVGDKFEAIKDKDNNITGYKLLEDVKIPANTRLKNAISEELTGHKYNKAQGYTTTTSHKVGGITLTGEVTVGGNTKLVGETKVDAAITLTKNSTIANGSKLEVGTTLAKGTTNPAVTGQIDNHKVEYEIGVNSNITVNTEGMDGIFEVMASCFNDIFNQIDASLVDDSITASDLGKMLTNKLDQIDEIVKLVSEKTSDLGSRMKRTTYIETRLDDQKTTFSSLLSETEDIDVEEVYTNFNVQFATYQSALQATSKIITNTLADYL